MDERASGIEPRGPSDSGPSGAELEMRALEERAAVLEREGRLEEAAAAYEALFGYAVGSGAVPWLVDALRWAAAVRGHQRRFEEAEELGEISRLAAEGHGLVRELARVTNLLGIFRHEQGDLEGAHRRYTDALEQAREIGDDQLIGFICQNLGVYANMQGDLRGARVLYLESIAGTLASRDDTNLTMAYNNLGMVCSDLGEWIESEVYFDRGIEVARRLDDRAQLARLCANRAEPLIRTADLARGRASLDEAEGHADACGAQSTLARIACLRALASRLEGDLGEAGGHIQIALDHARRGSLLLAEAEAMAELARLRHDEGRLAEAHADAVTARALFRKLGAARDTAEMSLLIQEYEIAAEA